MLTVNGLFLFVLLVMAKLTLQVYLFKFLHGKVVCGKCQSDVCAKRNHSRGGACPQILLVVAVKNCLYRRHCLHDCFHDKVADNEEYSAQQ